MPRTISSVNDFTRAIHIEGTKDRHQNYFRGHSDISYELVPTIYRQGLIYSEDEIFKESIMLTPDEFQHHTSTLERLVKMQHYGIPTRLLDVTTNPLVALYFACKGNPTKDGEVMFMQIPSDFVRFYDSDTVSVISNLCKRPEKFEVKPAQLEIELFNQTQHVQYLLHEIKQEKPYFQDIINPIHLSLVLAVKVKLDNPRILKQNGAFLLFGMKDKKTIPAEVPNSWILTKNSNKQLVIPSGKKSEILNKLNSIGINDSTLFPEIEYQGRFLIEKYKK